MRPTAIIPALLCVAALILSFLCLFAGHKKDFMEDYHLLTLNTSRIGYNLLNASSESDSSNPISNLFNDFRTDITNEITEEVNEFVGDTAERLGVDDFYSVHILDYCYGSYVPGVMPNATLDSDDISKNITACSNRTAAFHFEPDKIIEQRLNESGVDVTLDDLEWPEDIQRGLDALHILQTTVFVLYCIAIGFIFLSLIAALPAIFASGRLAACVNILLSALAFLAIGLASAIVTAVIVKGADVINKYGNRIGIEAHKGSKFLAITWAATALMFLTLVWWLVEVCIGRKKRTQTYAKHG